jgi:hypothetical protein
MKSVLTIAYDAARAHHWRISFAEADDVAR